MREEAAPSVFWWIYKGAWLHFRRASERLQLYWADLEGAHSVKAVLKGVVPFVIFEKGLERERLNHFRGRKLYTLCVGGVLRAWRIYTGSGRGSGFIFM